MTASVRWYSVLFAGALLIASSAARAAEEEAAQDVAPDIRELRNDQPAFYVHVDVDRKDRRYQFGQELTVSVCSEKAGFLYLIYVNSKGHAHCVFPNQYHQDNRILGDKQAMTIPSQNDPFLLRVKAPAGKELLKAIVTLEQTDVRTLVQQEINKKAIKDIGVELKKQETARWSEHAIEITTVDSSADQPPPAKRRVGVFVGVAKFIDPNIRQLKVADKDALAMAEVMEQYGQLTRKPYLLVNEQATLEAIRKVFCEDLLRETGPGDEVFIYWSGHGWHCAAKDPKEADGHHEMLVPHDGRIDNQASIERTMLLDDTFGQWIQNLDRRRVVVVLDACYSAGQHDQAKSIQTATTRGDEDVPFDFFCNWRRTKDLGIDVAMLASSKANQVSFERKEGDLSVMTFCLADRVRQGQVTLKTAYESLQAEVPKYVEARFPGATQTPILINMTSEDFRLRP